MNLFKLLFGSSSNGKSLAETAVDAVDRFSPSDVKKHEMAIEDLKAGDESQNSARQMNQISHDSWLDVFVDAINRMVRPAFTLWAFGQLVGIWDTTTHWENIPPMAWNIIWTIVTFWFGARVIFKDLPSAIRLYKELK